MVWLNTITDPPFHTEKINVHHNLLKIRLFLDALSRLYNAVGGRGLSVRSLHLVGNNAVERMWAIGEVVYIVVKMIRKH